MVGPAQGWRHAARSSAAAGAECSCSSAGTRTCAAQAAAACCPCPWRAPAGAAAPGPARLPRTPPAAHRRAPHWTAGAARPARGRAPQGRWQHSGGAACATRTSAEQVRCSRGPAAPRRAAAALPGHCGHCPPAAAARARPWRAWALRGGSAGRGQRQGPLLPHQQQAREPQLHATLHVGPRACHARGVHCAAPERMRAAAAREHAGPSGPGCSTAPCPPTSVKVAEQQLHQRRAPGLLCAGRGGRLPQRQRALARHVLRVHIKLLRRGLFGSQGTQHVGQAWGLRARRARQGGAGRLECARAAPRHAPCVHPAVGAWRPT